MRVVLAVAGLVFAMGAVIAIAELTDDGESAAGDTAVEAHATPTPTRRPAAVILACPGAIGVRASYEETENEFTLVGSLESVDGGYFVVEVPQGEIDLVLAGDSIVKGEYALGDAVRIKGRLSAETRQEAVNVEPACGLVVAEVPTGTPAPTAAVASGSPTPTPVVPLRPPVPVFFTPAPVEEVTEAPTEAPIPAATAPPEPTQAPTEPPPTEDPRPTRTDTAEETPSATQ
jgi:hypothetical protein